MTWTLDLPDQPYITPNSRPHWSRRAQCARAWRDSTMLLAKAAKVPSLDRAEIELVMHPRTRHRRDPDSLALVGKWCIDGLVDAGVLVDDDATRVVRVSYRIVPVGSSPREAGHRWLLRVRDATESEVV